MYQREAALSAVIELAPASHALRTELFQVSQFGCFRRLVNASAIQQINHSLAVPRVEPVPDLLTVDSGAPAHKRLLNALRLRIHGDISKLLPQLLQNLVPVPQRLDLGQPIVDDTVVAVVEAVLLMLLLLACWVYTGGWWIIGGMAITAVCLALPWTWWAIWRFYGKYVLPLCAAALTVWVFPLLTVIWAFAGGDWLFSVAFPLALMGAAFFWAGFSVFYWLKAGPWLKAGITALLVSFATPAFNSLCGLLIEDMGGPSFLEYFSVGDMLVRRAAGDVSWVNPLIFQLMLMCAMALTAVGAVVEVRRRRG